MSTEMPTPARADALLGAGYLARNQGDLTAARSWFEASLSDFRGIGDTYGIGSARRAIGLLAQAESDFARARTCLEEAVTLFRETGHILEIAWTLRNLGILAQVEGDSRGRMASSRKACRSCGGWASRSAAGGSSAAWGSWRGFVETTGGRGRSLMRAVAYSRKPGTSGA
jgi:tetratricopeptide (TPR) repeat protein